MTSRAATTADTPLDPTPLAASLRPRHVAMISLGGVVGAGLFVGSSTAIQIAGPASMLAYLLAGTIAFLMMRMLGEMAVARPGPARDRSTPMCGCRWGPRRASSAAGCTGISG